MWLIIYIYLLLFVQIIKVRHEVFYFGDPSKNIQVAGLLQHTRALKSCSSPLFFLLLELFLLFIYNIYLDLFLQGKGRQVNVAFRIRNSWGMRRGDEKDFICYHSLDLFQVLDAHFGAHIIKKIFHLYLNLLLYHSIYCCH